MKEYKKMKKRLALLLTCILLMGCMSMTALAGDECEHKYGEINVLLKPTCIKEGVGTKTCELCNHKVRVDIDALGHTEEVVPGKAATCTEAGLTDGKECSVCKEVLSEQEEIPALGHTEEVIPGKAATCTEAGLTDGKKCSVCGEVFSEQEEIPALGHIEEVVPGKAATAAEAGLTEGRKCSVCGETLVAQEEIPALGESGSDNQGGTNSLEENNNKQADDANTALAVKESYKEAPRTGDSSSVGIYLALAFLSGISILGVLKKKAIVE